MHPSTDPIPLSSLLDPNFTFEQLATAHNTTLEAIALWMTTPDVQDRLATIEAAAIQRTRIIAHRYLPAVAIACHSIVQRFNNPQALAAVDPQDHAAMDHERRNAETARRAGRLLLQLARFRKVPNTAPATADSPGGTGSSPAREEVPDTNSPSTNPTPQPPSTIDIFALLATPEFQAALTTALNSPPTPLAEPKTPPPLNTDPASPARDSGRNTLSPGRETRERASDLPKPAERATHAHHPGENNAHEHTTLPHARAP